jgi:hypothetical protein
MSVLDHLDRGFNVLSLKNLAAIYLPVTDLSIYSNYQFRSQITTINVHAADTIKVSFKNSQETLTIFNKFRYVAQLLPKELNSCLVVAGYAWDGNSYPGNEYWKDSVSSFDSMAILCSNLGQFQNPEVNVKLADAERIKIY